MEGTYLIQSFSSTTEEEYTPDPEHLDGLYRACEFGMLNERHKAKKKAEKLKKEQDA